MNTPTRGQWRGYIVLSCILLLALAALVFVPHRGKSKSASGTHNDNATLEELVDLYGDSIEQHAFSNHPFYRQPRRSTPPSTKRFQSSEFDTAVSKQHFSNVVVELNTADTATLQLLYGIGPVFASRIVKYRSLLGGYVRTEQLREVYGMTDERYNQILPYITVDTGAVDKIHINSATIDQLRRHPYIDYYQAKAIVQFRQQGNNLTNMTDLLLVNLIDEETVAKLYGYIQFN